MRFHMRRLDIVWYAVMLTMVWVGPISAGEQNLDKTSDILKQIDVLDLKTAAKIALSENPSLAAAQARVAQAAQVVKQAQAPYWPQLDAAAGYSRVDLSPRDFEAQYGIYNSVGSAYGLTPIPNPENYYQVSLKASWLVFNGLARKFTLATARYGEKATASARDDAQRLLLSAVTSAYLQTQLAQENVAIAKADEAFNKRLLTEARLRYDVGTGALSDVLNFQVRMNGAQSNRLKEERIYQTGLISLAALMGIPQGELPDHLGLAELSPTTPQELSTPRNADLVGKALTQRPDLKQSDFIVQQVEASVNTARAGYYPSIALSATYTGQRPEDAAFESDDFGNTIGVGLNWNIFAGGLTRAKTGEAKAKLFEAKSARADAVIKVTSEIKRITTQITAAQEQLTLQETNTQLVQQQRDLVEKEYKAGVGSLVRLNEAQRDLIVSQAQLASARVALRVFWYDLQTATGQISDTFK